VFFQSLQSRDNRGLQRRQILGRRMPYRFKINAVVLMAQPVTKASNIGPRGSGTQCFRLWPKPNGRFADFLQVTFNGVDCLYVFTKP
jgi:hypothetical protein